MDRRILTFAALLVLPAATRAAGDAPLDRATLRGLTGVGVVIDVIDPELEKLGVTRDLLLTRLLGRLADDGIQVDPSAKEFLGLRINAVRAGHGPYAVSVTLGFYQPVLLARDREIRTSTMTWEVESVLLADPKVLPTACGETGEELSDRFAAAFHAVNR